jgi:hypothetical protein
MSRYLENMRQKPERERKRLALFSSLGITLVLAAIWIATIPVRFGPAVASQTAAVDDAGNSDSQSFDEFKQQMNGNLSGFEQVMNQNESGTQVTPVAEPTTDSVLISSPQNEDAMSPVPTQNPYGNNQ